MPNTTGGPDGLIAQVVIYDPKGGFVTGGGWIDSPLDAYLYDPSLTGKATFGFVSKYLKGANAPTGQTEFQFKAGNSTSTAATMTGWWWRAQRPSTKEPA